MTNILLWECKQLCRVKWLLNLSWNRERKGSRGKEQTFFLLDYSPENKHTEAFIFLISRGVDPQLCRPSVNQNVLKPCPVSGPDTDQSLSTPCPDNSVAMSLRLSFILRLVAHAVLREAAPVTFTVIVQS